VFRYFRGAYCLHLLVHIDAEVSGEKLALKESENLEMKAVPPRKVPKPPRKPDQNI
jgi:hypothetical protein